MYILTVYGWEKRTLFFTDKREEIRNFPLKSIFGFTAEDMAVIMDYCVEKNFFDAIDLEDGCARKIIIEDDCGRIMWDAFCRATDVDRIISTLSKTED